MFLEALSWPDCNDCSASYRDLFWYTCLSRDTVSMLSRGFRYHVDLNAFRFRHNHKVINNLPDIIVDTYGVADINRQMGSGRNVVQFLSNGSLIQETNLLGQGHFNLSVSITGFKVKEMRIFETFPQQQDHRNTHAHAHALEQVGRNDANDRDDEGQELAPSHAVHRLET